MILYATIIPYNPSENDTVNSMQELIRVLINSIEVIFIFYLLKGKNNFSENENGLKVLAVGLGWSLADSLCMHLFYFLMNATGEEFTWEYIQTGILSNVDLIEKIGMVALIQSLITLSTEKKFSGHILLFIIGKYLFSAFGFKKVEGMFLKNLSIGDKWEELVGRIAVAAIFGIFCKIVFRVSNKTEEEKAMEEYNKMKSKKKI